MHNVPTARVRPPLWPIYLCVAVTALGIGIVNPIIPQLLQENGADEFVIGLTTSVMFASLVLTAWPPVDLPREVVLHATVATRDASDKAHNVHEPGTSLLINGEAVNTQGKARRYPRSQMTSRGVAFDSSFDELHLRSSRLARAGVRDLGPATVRAAGGDACSRLSADAIARGRGVARGLQKVIDCNRAVWECGPMPRW